MSFFAARQPILDCNRDLYGYELLFRASLKNVFPDVNEEKATSKMIEGLQLDLGLDRISAGKLAFINFTHQSLLDGYPLLLPEEKVAIEVLETAKPDHELYTCLKSLKAKGYKIVLDDFVHQEEWEVFYPLVHIIKVDYLCASQSEIESTVAICKKYPHIELLAEKVETNEEFETAKSLGFKYFQGYFFARPEVIKSIALTPSQSTLSRLLNEVSKDEPDFQQITKIFELDVTLSFKLLRYTQSPLFRRSKPIENIRQAVILLGQKELERFIILLFAAQFGEGKPSELIKLSMQRAKFCEMLAAATNKIPDHSSAFLAGMLSLIDAMLDADLDEIVSNLPLSPQIKNALLEKEGWLATFLEVCEHFEKANWAAMEKGCVTLGVDYNKLLVEYDEASQWTEERLDGFV